MPLALLPGASFPTCGCGAQLTWVFLGNDPEAGSWYCSAEAWHPLPFVEGPALEVAG